MVSFENGHTKLKFGTELHMEVYNGCILARICSYCVGQHIFKMASGSILNNSFIHKIFIFHETMMKFGDRFSQFRSWMTQFLPISLATWEMLIFKMASEAIIFYCIFHKIIKDHTHSEDEIWHRAAHGRSITNLLLDRIFSCCGIHRHSQMASGSHLWMIHS